MAPLGAMLAITITAGYLAVSQGPVGSVSLPRTDLVPVADSFGTPSRPSEPSAPTKKTAPSTLSAPGAREPSPSNRRDPDDLRVLAVPACRAMNDSRLNRDRFEALSPRSASSGVRSRNQSNPESLVAIDDHLQVPVSW